VAQREARDQRQPGAQDEEHHAGDEGHVVARDRQHMADAGNEHGVEHAAGQRIALAGDEGRRDGGGVARDRRADAGIDAVADRFDRGGEPQAPSRRGRRRRRFDRAKHKAGGADALEV
jgi:hypothetical protein